MAERRTSARATKDAGHGQGKKNGAEKKEVAVEGKKKTNGTLNAYYCSRDYCSNNFIEGKIITL